MRETFAALDALTRDEMQGMLVHVWRETRKTVIYVTHNVAEAFSLADRVVVLTPIPVRCAPRPASPAPPPRRARCRVP